MMPKMDGWQVCREIRESSKVSYYYADGQIGGAG